MLESQHCSDGAMRTNIFEDTKKWYDSYQSNWGMELNNLDEVKDLLFDSKSLG